MARVILTGIEWAEITTELAWDTELEDSDLMILIEDKLPDEFWESEEPVAVELSDPQIRRVSALRAELVRR
jgi:hypothetical protein